MSSTPAPAGRDTPTGTDPEAKYDQPGYEDKSFGQAVDEDQEKVDELVAESDGDLDAAEARFNDESAGAPALHRQSAEEAGDAPTDRKAADDHRTGEAQADRNRADDPPA